MFCPASSINAHQGYCHCRQQQYPDMISKTEPRSHNRKKRRNPQRYYGKPNIGLPYRLLFRLLTSAQPPRDEDGCDD